MAATRCVNLQREENGDYVDNITLEIIPPEELFSRREELLLSGVRRSQVDPSGRSARKGAEYP